MHDVLVIDDDEMMIELIAALLEDEPCTVRGAPDAEQGLELIASAVPDLVIVDMNLPGMDGCAFTRTLHGDARMRHIPVAIGTSDGSVDCRTAAADAGCAAFLLKPFYGEDFISEVRRLLASGHAAPAMVH